MSLNTASLSAAAGGPGLAPAITHLALHSADPGTGGGNETAAGRKPVAWDENNGELTIPAEIEFTGLPPGDPVTHVGLWGADTGGVFYGGLAIVGDQEANAAGEFRLTGVTLTGTAT